MKKIASIIGTLVFCVSVLPAFAGSNSDNHSHDGTRHHTPPAEAIEACKGLSAQDTCQFNGRNNELVSGVCETPRAAKADDTNSLICRPKREGKDKPTAENTSSN